MAEIGKNIIENLTIAMYEDSFTVFREYIQNSADSIDKAIKCGILEKSSAYIDIDIDDKRRNISIYDNACGIRNSEFYKILSDIADSQKVRGQDKGFRGIGRLAGLAYCDKLIFVSSYKGETIKSTMEWDGVKLRQILNDPNNHVSASELVDDIIECKKECCGADEHFFEVVMENVISESSELLDEGKVTQYLNFVAPISYGHFIFKEKIYKFAADNNFHIDEYNINLNGNALHKPYKTYLYAGNLSDSSQKGTQYDEIRDVEFKIFTSDEGEILAWMWYGLCKFEKNIPVINAMRGIRLRKENIQIGDSSVFSKFFKEQRGKYYFVGEVFAVHHDLIPNARRDYFNPNSTLRNFENSIHSLFYDKFCRLYHYANNVKNLLKKIQTFQQAQQDFNIRESKAEFINEDDKQQSENSLNKYKANANKAKHELCLRKKDADNDAILEKVYNQILESYTVEAVDIENMVDTDEKKPKNPKKKEKKYLSQSLVQYSKKEQKLISKIYGIINNLLPPDTAMDLVNKIQKELSK